MDELLLIARSLTERLKSLPPSSYTWKLPELPNDEQLKLYTSFQVSVTANLGVFSCPDPLKVATVRAVAAAAVADADVEAAADADVEAAAVGEDSAAAGVDGAAWLPPPAALAIDPMMISATRPPSTVKTLWRRGHDLRGGRP